MLPGGMNRKPAATPPSRRRRREWFDDDEFWREFYPIMFSEDRFGAAAAALDPLLALAAPKGKDVLDLCCGPGRFAVPLAQRGYHVTGVDRTEYLLSKARAYARRTGVKVEWVRSDMRDFARPEAFYLVLNMFTSFGYFDAKDEDLAVLENVFVSLKPGGVLVVEIMGKEVLARIFAPTSSRQLPDGTLFIERRQIRDNWTRIYNEWIILRNGRARTFKFHHTIYSAEELRDRLQRVGFVDVGVYGSLERADYEHTAERLVVTARKPA
jgi:SAM-dependent methyltransferase